MDSGGDVITKDGSGNDIIEVECKLNSVNIYSVNMQKNTESGSLTVEVIQNGAVLDKGSTTSAYGIVHLVGDCGEPS